MKIWLLIYNIVVVPIFWIAFQIAGKFNRKIYAGIVGRKDLFKLLSERVKLLPPNKTVWFHSSSLGEFEQAKPIIQALKKKYPDINIAATFFSPSGFDHSKNYRYADIISYIPFDSKSNAKKFINILKPAVAVMVRYDIWPNIIWELKKNRTPIFIANATMQKNSIRKYAFAKYFHRSLYDNFSHILTVSESDRTSFLAFGITTPKIFAIGDSRYDQVIMRSEDAKTKNILPPVILQGKKVFIVGQSWNEDEEIILPVLFKIQDQEENLLTIVVPHEPTIEHLEQLEAQLENKTSYIRFSEINNFKNQKVILIDSVGVLVALYKYAHVVYIGGSFKQGIHNVLEPAVFGVPIIYGPKHTNSQEAVELAKSGAGFVIHDERELYRTLRRLLDDVEIRYQSGKIAQSFVHQHCGATDRFLQYLEPFLQQ